MKPTKPGFYWFRDSDINEDKWKPAEVYFDQDGRGYLLGIGSEIDSYLYQTKDSDWGEETVLPAALSENVVNIEG